MKVLLETAGVTLTRTEKPAIPPHTQDRQPRIIFFDATARRRARLGLADAHAPHEESEIRHQRSEIKDQGPEIAERLRLADAHAPHMASEIAVPSTESGNGQPPALNRDEVTEFMVNFVVDQTGYPAEMVELDADLEADLGIDSIKKAQLIGELAENYTLTHLTGQLQNLSLDDFRTIRSILDFVVDGGTGSRLADVEITEAVADQGSETAERMRSADAHAPHEASEISVPSTESGNGQPPALNRDEVTEFMVNFVVDQTGYPAEMVELDADLEADLGIDSIKKAQLIGELAENYTLTHLTGQLQNLSLDDFRTIRSILDFVVDGGSSRLADAETTEAVADQGSETAERLRLADAHAPHEASEIAVPSTESGNGQPPALNRDEVTEFMVNFVVDQTGYPAEMVELDADLEADLGIDSIKKAQLIGELAENYTLTHLTGQLQNLSLDDFRTIRSILDFVVDGDRLR